VMVYITRLTLPGLLNGSCFGFVMENEGGVDCHWLDLVHSSGREDLIDTHVIKALVESVDGILGLKWILLDDCTYINFMTLKIHLQ
jgi:hypothetical protein